MQMEGNWQVSLKDWIRNEIEKKLDLEMQIECKCFLKNNNKK